MPRSRAWQRYTKYSNGSKFDHYSAPPGLVAATYVGMFAASSDQDMMNYQNRSCPTSYCTFKKYQSLGVCYQCANLSVHDLALSVNFSLMKNSLVRVFSTTDYPIASANFTTGPLIVSMYAVGRPNLTATPSAAVCALQWCVSSYSGTTFEGGVWDEEARFWTNKTSSARTNYAQLDDIILTPPDCYSPGDCTYTVGHYAQLGLQNFFTAEDTGLYGCVNSSDPAGGWTRDTGHRICANYIFTRHQSRPRRSRQHDYEDSGSSHDQFHSCAAG